MRIIILGPQGSGKGTQAELLKDSMHLTHINVGECLREEVAAGTPLGRRLKDAIDRGELVSNEHINKLVGRLIREAGSRFIIDGFPRTKDQAQFLDLATSIDKVIVLKLPDKAAVERIGGRRECPNGHDFHVTYNPPRKEGICDECGLPLARRKDDNSMTIMKRLALYHRETEPILSHYAGKIIEIDSSQPIMKVHQDIMRALRQR